MAHRLCENCMIKYPSATGGYTECVACGRETVYDPFGLADTNWADKAERAMKIILQLESKARHEFPHIDAVTFMYEGREYVHSYDVIKYGGMPENPDVITIGPPREDEGGPDDNIYEVIGYSDEQRAYWVRRLRVPDYVDA